MKPRMTIAIVLVVLVVLFRLGFSFSELQEVFTPSEEAKARMPFSAGMLDRTAETGQDDLWHLFGLDVN